MTRQPRRIAGGVVAAVALLLVGCSGDEPGTEETTPTTDPVVTAPPTMTPEEQAEQEIITTFKGLIRDLDEYYANASDYSVEEVSSDSPALGWRGVPGTGEASLELSNWVVHWRNQEIEAVGNTNINTHEVTDIRLDVTQSGMHEATSVACRDLTSISFVTYDGQSADLSFDPNQYQIWEMIWNYVPDVAPESGITEPGWYLQSFDLTLDEPC